MKNLVNVLCIAMIACLLALITPNMAVANTLQAGDKIYFGEFWNQAIPQSELDAKGSAKFEKASFVNMGVSDFMSGNEDSSISCSEIDGETYARRDNRSGPSYYKMTPIRWRVLNVSNGKAYLMADYVLLPTGVHNNSNDNVTWEKSLLRSFLNGYGQTSNAANKDFTQFNFLNIAFTKNEQDAIVATDTKDKISIPSVEDMTNYFATDEERKMKEQTPYVSYTSSYYLQTAGEKAGTFAFVNASGNVITSGVDSNNNNLGIAPSIIVDLSKLDFVSSNEQNTYSANVKAEIQGKPVSVFPFKDVTEQSWYYDSVRLAYEDNLMLGMSDTEFAPMNDVSVAQAIAMASRVHYDNNPGKAALGESTPWYKTYIDYALKEGIINGREFSNYERPITRSELAYLFGNALPKASYLEINNITALPDVDMKTPYAESIFLLYRAGVLRGSGENGIFYPERNITRAETASIIVRVKLQEKRLNFILQESLK